jgi:uncharacterized repeat protein (TIGR02543 family)
MWSQKHKYLFVLTTLALLLSLLGLGCPTTTQTYTLTTNVSPAGAGSVSPPGGEYDLGLTVTLTANAASGYTFDHWSGSAAGTNPTAIVVMDAHKNVTAHFTPVAQTYTLTANVSPSGSGSVSPSGGSYGAGVTVTLTANAASGYTFDYWSGSAAGTTPTANITMDSDKSVTAHFAEVGPTVLFSDDFSRDTGVWDTFSDSDGSVFYENGWLHIINKTTATYCTYTMAHQYFTDFILEVETKLVDGTDDNWHHVTFREEDADNYYDFGISADGYYDLTKVVNGNQIVIAGPTRSSNINQGWDVTNLIHIECIGSSLSLSVNGHLLKSTTDTTFTAGDIGLSASSLAGSFSEIAFDNIVVTEP